MFRALIVLAVAMALFLPPACSPGEEPSEKTTPAATAEEKTSPTPTTITFGVDPTWPPFEYLDEDGKVVGLSVDYVQEIGRAAGFDPIFVPVPWDGIFDGLLEGKYDAICSSVSITEDRCKIMAFSEPYFKARQVLVTKVESAAVRLEEMAGRVVGAQVGTTGAAAVEKAGGVVPEVFEDLDSALEALADGRVQGVVCDDPAAAHFVLTGKKYLGKLRIAGVVESGGFEYYGIAAAKNKPAILAAINRGLAKVKAAGLDAKLIERWMTPGGRPSRPKFPE
ncbi:MAG: transporter substrate-binding domain-containing protein [Pseudomonadota bacterium]